MSSELVNVDLSMFYRLMQIIRLEGFWIDVVDGATIKVTGETNAYQLAKHTGNPFVYLDEAGLPYSNGLVVKVNGCPIDPATYAVDYRTGKVTLAASTTAPVTITARVSVFKVTDGYPDEDYLKMNDLPIIGFAVDANLTGMDFAIGGGAKWRHRICKIDILARTKTEAEDSLDRIQRDMEKVKLLDMATVQPLTPDGQLNISFNPDTQLLCLLKMSGITGTLLKPRQNGSDKERHRALLVLETESVS